MGPDGEDALRGTAEEDLRRRPVDGKAGHGRPRSDPLGPERGLDGLGQAASARLPRVEQERLVFPRPVACQQIAPAQNICQAALDQLGRRAALDMNPHQREVRAPLLRAGTLFDETRLEIPVHPDAPYLELGIRAVEHEHGVADGDTVAR